MTLSNHPSILIKGAHLHTPARVLRPGWLLTGEGLIRDLGEGNPPNLGQDDPVVLIDAAGKSLLPGLIDLHVHGGLGHDVMDASPEGIRQIARFLASHGVTAFLATTWTAPTPDILSALDTIAQIKGRIYHGATLLGAYLEGPYLNPEKCGAQDARHIRLAEKDEAIAFLESGAVRVVALAPEFSQNLWLVEECYKRGVVATAAHTTASYEQMQKAVQRGLRLVTHCFNAMSGLHQREPGTVGAALTIPELFCELIADNVHVHPVLQKLLWQLKGPSGLILVSDGTAMTGLPDGEYNVQDRKVRVRDSIARLENGALAGSTLTIEKSLGNLQLATGCPIAEISPSTSLNAAKLLGIDKDKGSLEMGKHADLIMLDDDFQVWLTVVEGEIVFRRQDLS